MGHIDEQSKATSEMETEDHEELAREVHADICAHGWSERLGAFTQSYGSDDLDAANLLLAEYGFLAPTDPRARERMVGAYAGLTMRTIRAGVTEVVWVVPPTPTHFWDDHPEMSDPERYQAHHEIVREADEGAGADGGDLTRKVRGCPYLGGGGDGERGGVDEAVVEAGEGAIEGVEQGGSGIAGGEGEKKVRGEDAFFGGEYGL